MIKVTQVNNEKLTKIGIFEYPAKSGKKYRVIASDTSVDFQTFKENSTELLSTETILQK